MSATKGARSARSNRPPMRSSSIRRIDRWWRCSITSKKSSGGARRSIRSRESRMSPSSDRRRGRSSGITPGRGLSMRSDDGRRRTCGNAALIAVLCGFMAFRGAATAGQAEKPPAAVQPTATPLPATADESVDGLATEAVQAHLKAVETNKDLDEANRAKLVDAYNRVLQQLKLAETAKTRGAAIAAMVESAPEELRRLKEQGLPPPDAAAAANPADVPLAE